MIILVHVACWAVLQPFGYQTSIKAMQSVRSCSPRSTLQGVRKEALYVQVVPAGRHQIYGHGRWQVILRCADVNPLQVGDAYVFDRLVLPKAKG